MNRRFRELKEKSYHKSKELTLPTDTKLFHLYNGIISEADYICMNKKEDCLEISQSVDWFEKVKYFEKLNNQSK